MAQAETPGQRIRRLRTERGLSQQAIAGPGVSSSHVCAVETGRREPTPATLRVIAAGLGVLPEYLETGRSATATDELAETVLARTDGALWIVLTRDGVAFTWQEAGQTRQLDRRGENVTEGLLVLAAHVRELARLDEEEARLREQRAVVRREHRQAE